MQGRYRQKPHDRACLAKVGARELINFMLTNQRWKCGARSCGLHRWSRSPMVSVLDHAVQNRRWIVCRSMHFQAGSQSRIKSDNHLRTLADPLKSRTWGEMQDASMLIILSSFYIHLSRSTDEQSSPSLSMEVPVSSRYVVIYDDSIVRQVNSLHKPV